MNVYLIEKIEPDVWLNQIDKLFRLFKLILLGVIFMYCLAFCKLVCPDLYIVVMYFTVEKKILHKIICIGKLFAVYNKERKTKHYECTALTN